jgi:hypothetical protein
MTTTKKKSEHQQQQQRARRRRRRHCLLARTVGLSSVINLMHIDRSSCSRPIMSAILQRWMQLRLDNVSIKYCSASPRRSAYATSTDTVRRVKQQ